MNDQIREYTADIVYVMVTKEFYDDAQEYKKADKRVAHFDEPIAPEPFFHNEYDARIIAYRKHLLKALGYIANGKDWIKLTESNFIMDTVHYDEITEASDNVFMDRIQQLTTIDFKGE